MDLMKLSGKFIVFDGIDGSGKSLQVQMLQAALQDAGVRHLCTRDPGGSQIGGQIRRLILNCGPHDIGRYAEMMLFMASRAQLIACQIGPSLSTGDAVICDRFVSASCAYQGARGIPLGSILQTASIATRGTWPDLTIILDIPVDVAASRVSDRDAITRRHQDYHNEVADTFRTLGQSYPGRYEVIEASGAPEAVHDAVMECIESNLIH